MLKKNPTGFYTFLLVFVLSILAIGNWIDRTQSTPLILSFCTAFMAYVFVLQEKENPKILLGLGIILRIVLFFSMPSLSDDVYRFIWDGTLLKSGIHPFEQLPTYYLNQNVQGINQALFDRLNSQPYFSIYPPLNQLIFWVSVSIGSENWLISTIAIRVILLLADVGSFFLLKKLLSRYGKSEHLAFWFLLNPLVILEFTGNLHFEGLVLLFLLAGIHFFEAGKKLWSGSSIGLAIGVKLLPLIYLPFLFLKGIKEKKWSISILAGIVGLATILPMLSQAFISGMQTSLDLYFRSFEFNASIYFIAREIGYWIYGYNNIAQIGPLLSILSIVSILVISVIGTIKKWPIPKTFLFILTTYLTFTTTVHPWYILPLVALGILSGYWYPIVWSFLIFFTYLGYTNTGFELPMITVISEYVVVSLILIFELKTKAKLLVHSK
ncbi:MAG: glycosyltransferase 87 family protein [Ekhidna sp.]